jgi:hypothetical protein
MAFFITIVIVIFQNLKKMSVVDSWLKSEVGENALETVVLGFPENSLTY